MIQLLRNLIFRLGYSLYYFAGYLHASFLGVELGVGVRVSPRARVRGVRYLGAVQVAACVSMGKGTYMNSGIVGSGSIGRYCSIGPDVIIGPNNHDLNLWSTSPYAVDQGDQAHPPLIGDDVWIGAKAVILRGVNVGNGAVIAAGAIVTGDVAPYVVVGGIPGRQLKERFSDPAQRRAAEEGLAQLLGE